MGSLKTDKARVHPKIVQEMLGHSTITMTQGIDSHIILNLQSEAARTLYNFLPINSNQKVLRDIASGCILMEMLGSTVECLPADISSEGSEVALFFKVNRWGKSIILRIRWCLLQRAGLDWCVSLGRVQNSLDDRKSLDSV